MSNVQQGCADCTDQDVVNTGDGKGPDVITMTGPLGEVFTKALAVYLSKTPVEGYTEVAAESQSQDAMLAQVVVSDAVKNNLMSIKNMVEVATGDEDRNQVPTAIAYVTPAQKTTDPETVVFVQDLAQACKKHDKDFIFVVDAFSKQAVYSDFNTMITPSDKDDKINFYNACKGFQRATESLYGPDVHVVVGMEQLADYMVSRYKLKMAHEEIKEQMRASHAEDSTQEESEQEVATEGIVDFLKNFFSGKDKSKGKEKSQPKEAPKKKSIDELVKELQESVDKITPGEHSVNKIHLFKSNSVVATLEHKAKQVQAIIELSKMSIAGYKQAVSFINANVGKVGDIEDGDEWITEQSEKFRSFRYTNNHYALFDKQDEFVGFERDPVSELSLYSYRLNYHTPKEGSASVALKGSDVTKIKQLVSKMVEVAYSIPTEENKDADIYYDAIAGFSRAAKDMLSDEDEDYMSGNPLYDAIVDITESVYNRESVLMNTDTVLSVLNSLLNLVKSLEGDAIAEEGFKEWLGGLFKGKSVKENKPKENAGIVEHLTHAKSMLQKALDSNTTDAEIEVSIPKASNSSDVKKVAAWFVSIFDSAESIVKASIDIYNENIRNYIPLAQVWHKEYSAEMEKEYNQLASALETKQRNLRAKLTSIYKGVTIVKGDKNKQCLAGPLEAVLLELPYIPEPYFDNDWFGVEEVTFPYAGKDKYDKRTIKFTDSDHKSAIMSLIMAVDKAIDFFKEHEDAIDEDQMDMDSIHILSDINEDCCYEVIKYFYRGGQNRGLRAIADRLVAISKEMS